MCSQMGSLSPPPSCWKRDTACRFQCYVLADQGIWSEGNNYAASIIILVKIDKPNAEGVVTAKCTVTMYNTGFQAQQVFSQRLPYHPFLNYISTKLTLLLQTLFPRPQTSLQHIPITMLQIYLETLPQGILPNMQVYLELDVRRLALVGSINK